MNLKTFDTDEFLEPYQKFLERSGKSRLYYYKRIITKLVNLNRPIFVVETGTMWSKLEDNMGAFTLVFADLIKNWTGGKLITIDISEENIEKCKITTSEYSVVVEYVVSDSVKYLESLPDEIVNKIDFIYFDSFDFHVPDPIPSQLHHFRELMAVYKRLSTKVNIAVDDNFLPNCWVEWITYNPDLTPASITKYETGSRIFGKGTLIDYFLLQEGWKRIDDWLHIDTYHLLGYEKEQKKTIDEVYEILKSFYDNVESKELSLDFPIKVNSIFNPDKGLGDGIILTCVSPQIKIQNQILQNIKFEYFDTDCLTNEKSHSIKNFIDFDTEGGHCTQRIQKVLGIKPSFKPKGNLYFNPRKKIKNKTFVHLVNGTDHKRVIPNSLSEREIEKIKIFFQENPQLTPFYYENNLEINDLISEIETCEFFLGIDSGPMHIAAALELRSIVIINDPNNCIFLPKIKECDIPNSEWLYPQNVHLNREGLNELVPNFSIQNLYLAFKGEIYPYWSEDYLSIKYKK